MAFAQFQFRRDTAANWTAANPILAEGEIGLELDTDQFKIGDGVTAWTSLTYGGLQGPAGADGAPGADGADGADGAETPLNPAVFPHIATPSDPGAGNTSLYAKTDGKLYYLPTGGSEAEVGSGSGGREVLTGNRTYYVRTDGNDSNNGLSDSAGGAFLTPGKAISTLLSLDGGGYEATIKLTGTYTSTISLTGQFVGLSRIILEGDTVTPTNVTVNVSTGNCITVNTLAPVTVRGLYLLNSSSSGNGISVSGNSVVSISSLDFGAMGSSGRHIFISSGVVSATGNYTISGGCYEHVVAQGGTAVFSVSSKTITLTGTPAFSGQFVSAEVTGTVIAYLATFSGSATGKRYNVTTNAVINTYGGGATYFPGNVNGTVDATTYGVYA